MSRSISRVPAAGRTHLAFLVFAAVGVFGSACTVKMGGAPPSNYDYSEYETYERPHAESPSYAASAPPGAQ